MMQRLMLVLFVLLAGASPGAAQPIVETNQDFITAASQLTGPIPSAIDDALSPRQQFLVGLRLESGVGVTADVAMALRWFERAATRGFAPAQAWAGDFYRHGISGTVVDKPKAAGLYRAAAAQGWAYAQAGLGALLLVGDGVAVDVAEGEKWLRAAAGRDATADEFLPVLDRMRHEPPCRESFCAVLRLTLADAERDFSLLTSTAFNENNVADARLTLPGASSCGIVEETNKRLRHYACVFKGPAAQENDLLARIRRTLGLDGGGARWVATDDSYHFDPGPDCKEDPDEPFSDCAPDNQPAEHWAFKPLGYVDYYEYDFDYAQHRDAIAIADRIRIEVGPNPWGDGEGKIVQVFTTPHPDGPFEHRTNFYLYAYDTAISPAYTITVDGAVVGIMPGHGKSGNGLNLRIRDGVRRVRITDDATGYWEEFNVKVSAIFDHCFYDPARGINCMKDIAHTIPPFAHR